MPVEPQPRHVCAMTRFSAVVAIARFELRRALHDSGTGVATLLLPAMLVVGHWPRLTSGEALPAGSRLFAVGYLAAFIAGGRLRLGADRSIHFGRLLRANFVTVSERMFGKSLAHFISLCVLGSYAFLTAWAISLGELRYALWYSVLFTLIALLVSPAVVLVELFADSRLPVAVVLLTLAVASLLASRTGALTSLMEVMGVVEIQQYRYGTLRPLVARILIAVPILHVLLYPLWLLRSGGIHPLPGSAGPRR